MVMSAVSCLLGFLSIQSALYSVDCKSNSAVLDSFGQTLSLEKIYDFSKMENEINFYDRASVSCPTTWVTALSGLESLNCAHNRLCKDLIDRFARVQKCAVIFTDHEKPPDWIPAAAQDKIKWIPMSSHISSMRSDISLDWNRFFESSSHRSPQESYHRQWIVNLKPWFLDVSAKINPFSSSLFFWVDIILFSEKPVHLDMINFLPRMLPSAIGLLNVKPFTSEELHLGNGAQSWVHMNCKEQLSQPPDCSVENPRRCDERISGLIFGGHPEAVAAWRKAYYKSLQKSLSNNWFVGTHENAIVSACMEHPKICSLVMPECELDSQDLECLLSSFHTDFTKNSFHLQPSMNQEVTWVATEIGGQMGNQMFMMASSYGIAHSRKAKWCITNLHESKYLKNFKWRTQPVACPGMSLKIFNLTGDSNFWIISTVFSAANEGVGFARYTPSIVNSKSKDIFVGLFLQSYKYFKESGLPFVLKTQRSAQEWVHVNKVDVGIHVRRGDKHTDTGNVVTPLKYFFMAVKKMQDLHGTSLSFVVCTDDPAWVREQPPFQGMSVLSTSNPAFDMAVLAACQHHIMSIGTYGWWGTFLGDGPNSTNIYPVLQFTVPLIRGFSHIDYFPPNWIPIDYEREELAGIPDVITAKDL
jgi:hypothetical protein